MGGGLEDKKEKAVICVICKSSEPEEGKTTMTFDKDGATVVIRDVPARICANCGEAYMSEDVTTQLLRLAREAMQLGTEVVIRHYAAA